MGKHHHSKKRDDSSSSDCTSLYSCACPTPKPKPRPCKGPKGEHGEQGIPGPKGDSGVKGEQGCQGHKGCQGDMGPPGHKGCQGDCGGCGEKGCKGDKGDRGEKGEKGCPGEKGEKGCHGEKGDQGCHGDHGCPGEKGDRGIQGLRGEKGDHGDQGPQGCPGPLACPGERGDQGCPGEAGETGCIGIPGPCGPPAPIKSTFVHLTQNQTITLGFYEVLPMTSYTFPYTGNLNFSGVVKSDGPLTPIYDPVAATVKIVKTGIYEIDLIVNRGRFVDMGFIDVMVNDGINPAYAIAQLPAGNGVSTMKIVNMFTVDSLIYLQVNGSTIIPIAILLPVGAPALYSFLTFNIVLQELIPCVVPITDCQFI